MTQDTTTELDLLRAQLERLTAERNQWCADAGKQIADLHAQVIAAKQSAHTYQNQCQQTADLLAKHADHSVDPLEIVPATADLIAWNDRIFDDMDQAENKLGTISMMAAKAEGQIHDALKLLMAITAISGDVTD